MTQETTQRTVANAAFAVTFALAIPFASGGALAAQSSSDPFPDPIRASEGAVTVGFVDFATVPDADGDPARMMILVDEPGTERLFVNDMRGGLYWVGYAGGDASLYVNIDDPRWGVSVESGGRESGFQSFAFHPQFGQPGTPGFGKFYTWTDTDNTGPTPDFPPKEGGDAHDTVLLEWTATDPTAATYDGAAPRELLREQQPYGNHNAGQIGFNPTVDPGDPDFGMLYVGSADGGSGGDPQNMAQDLSSAFGKILRIDPLGSNSANGRYGIPEDNPFVADGDPATLGEIWAYGTRNPQRFAWDPANGALYMADIGQNTIETLNPVTRGANLGWNVWEGSFRFLGGRSGVGLDGQRSDPSVTYPIAEYAQSDPLLMNSAAATGVHVYRAATIPELTGRILWGDNPSGEIFHVSADNPPAGGQDPIRRVLLAHEGRSATFLEVIRSRNEAQGRSPARRADLRFGSGADGRVFLLNKQDGIVRLLVPAGM